MDYKMIKLFLETLLCVTMVVKAKAFNHPYIKKASIFAGKQTHFDYIIVGGGNAGCPLAATLSQRFNVLLLERGGSPYSKASIIHMQNFNMPLADTSPQSPSQAFLCTDGVFNARARVLGGGFCINAGYYTRASPRYIRDVGWDGELVNQSYPWVEKQLMKWPEVGPLQRAFRDGLLHSGVMPYNGVTNEHVVGTQIGGTVFDKKGFRSTAADLLADGDPTSSRS